MQHHGSRNGIWPTMAHNFDQSPIFLQVSLKFHKIGRQMSFNLQLLQAKEAKHQMLDAWQHGMDEAIGQGVGFQVAKALLFTKKNDTIFF
jgi:hypothetical protein